MMVNYYAVLEIPNFSDAKTVEAAYRKAAFKHHPDRGGDQEFMKLVNNASEVLRKDKVQYDAALHRALNPQPVVIQFYWGDFYTSASNYSTSTSSW